VRSPHKRERLLEPTNPRSRLGRGKKCAPSLFSCCIITDVISETNARRRLQNHSSPSHRTSPPMRLTTQTPPPPAPLQPTQTTSHLHPLQQLATPTAHPQPTSVVELALQTTTLPTITTAYHPLPSPTTTPLTILPHTALLHPLLPTILQPLQQVLPRIPPVLGLVPPWPMAAAIITATAITLIPFRELLIWVFHRMAS
jgi:hypothetical protein